jgi:hypothetical protein
MLGGIFSFLFSAYFHLVCIHCMCWSRFLNKKVERTLHASIYTCKKKKKVVGISGTEFEIAQFLFECRSRGWNGVLTSINTHTRPPQSMLEQDFARSTRKNTGCLARGAIAYSDNAIWFPSSSRCQALGQCTCVHAQTDCLVSWPSGFGPRRPLLSEPYAIVSTLDGGPWILRRVCEMKGR